MNIVCDQALLGSLSDVFVSLLGIAWGAVEAASMGAQEGGEGRRRCVARRLVLTAGAFLERRPATYEVAERRQLAALAALVRLRSCRAKASPAYVLSWQSRVKLERGWSAAVGSWHAVRKAVR